MSEDLPLGFEGLLDASPDAIVVHDMDNRVLYWNRSAEKLYGWSSDDKAKGMVAMIEKCATKGADLISDLLAFERGKGGGNEVIRKTQILRAIQRAKEAVMPDSIELNTVLADDLWEFHGEAAELADVYKHIMQNSCEAMPDGGTLTIEVTNCLCDENFANLAPEAKVGAYVSIAFKDTGFGIPKSIIDRVAEPFFTTKEPKQGYGFGLSNSQAVIKGHKGFMVLESIHGSGTTLTVYLPAHAAKPEPDISGLVVEDHTSGAGRMGLVADDELFIRETIKRTLEDRGYNVVTAQDGTEALAVYASRRDEIDMVVTNVEMPFMDGPALCRALRKLNPDVRILVSSGHKQREKVAEIKSSGVDQFLPKPYTADQLADRVRNILEG